MTPKTQKESLAAIYTTEAEFISMSNGLKCGLWLQVFLERAQLRAAYTDGCQGKQLQNHDLGGARISKMPKLGLCE